MKLSIHFSSKDLLGALIKTWGTLFFGRQSEGDDWIEVHVVVGGVVALLESIKTLTCNGIASIDTDAGRK